MNQHTFWRGVRKGVVSGIVVVLSLCAVHACVAMVFRLAGLDVRGSDWPRVEHGLNLIAIVAAAFVSGASVVVMRHPALNAAYRKWLVTTPWHPGRPLPLGNPTLGAGDLAFAAILGAFAFWRHGHGALLPLDALLAGYAAAAAWALTHTRRGEAWAIGWLAAALLLVVTVPPHAWAALPLLAAAGAVAGYGLRRSLAGFPWDFDADTSPQPREAGVWPFSRLAPGAVPEPSVHRARNQLRGAALAGWVVFCIGTLVQRQSPDATPHDLRQLVLPMCGWFTLVVAGLRWLAYRVNVQPPLSAWGRLRTGRWVVPGFDRILVAPLVIAAVGVGATTVVALLPGVAVPAALGLMVVVMLALCSRLPPSRHAWQLMGQFRFVPALQPASSSKRPQRTMR